MSFLDSQEKSWSSQEIISDLGTQSGRIPFLHELGNWKNLLEDFHLPVADHPMESQQDTVQWGWAGIVAAINSSINQKTETMGSGFVVGTGQQPDYSLSSLSEDHWRRSKGRLLD